MQREKNNLRNSSEMNRKAFTLVEVLIATLILSISILSISAALKQFFLYKEKLTKYQNLYFTTLSLIDRISAENLTRKPTGEGYINGLHFHYVAEIVSKNRNFMYGETEKTSGNKGNFEILLYKVKLYIGNKMFNFYVTQYRNLMNFTTIEQP
jgi:type II secretory pathway pseudopilin PulG